MTQVPPHAEDEQKGHQAEHDKDFHGSVLLRKMHGETKKYQTQHCGKKRRNNKTHRESLSNDDLDGSAGEEGDAKLFADVRKPLPLPPIHAISLAHLKSE
jgi:hypothetical protein